MDKGVIDLVNYFNSISLKTYMSAKDIDQNVLIWLTFGLLLVKK